MDPLSIINSLVLAAVLSLFMLELGAAIFLLLNYNKYKERLAAYVAPIWEITGTMSVFYVVSLEAFYPTLIAVVGALYVGPIILAMLFILVRDSFLAYSEYMEESATEVAYSKIYGISTIVGLALVVSVLSSGISGMGISVQGLTSNYLAMIFNPFNVLFLLAVVFLVIFASSIFFGVRSAKLQLPSFIIFVILLFASLYIYVPQILMSIVNTPYLLLPALLLLVAIFVLYLRNSRLTRFLVLPFLFISVFTFEAYQYPMLFGGQASITQYLTESANTPYLAVSIAVGGIFLIAALSYFVYIQHVHRKSEETKPSVK